MRTPAARETDPPDGRHVVHHTPCQGHAFDESLRCACGVSWFQHQRKPRRCSVDAQRCNRRAEAPPASEE